MAADPQRNLLNLSTPEEMENWRQEIAAFQAQLLARADDLFTAFLIAFGDKEGRQLWRDRLKRKRGRKPGPTRPDRDEKLLALYDEFVAGGYDPKRVPALIGTFLKDHPHFAYVDTSMVGADGLEQALRRALERREKERSENLLTAWFSKDK
jgi:hypothetical protein